VLPPDAAWQRIFHMHDVLAHQPAVARAVRSLSLYDQLSLTLEVLSQADWPDAQPVETLPPNVLPFRRR
jgi:hypothetical protein